MLERLKDIVKATDANIVLSSDWRLDWTGSDMYELRAFLGKYGLTITDRTELVGNGLDRQEEIYRWLKNHQDIGNFVILDDDYFFPKFRDNFVMTNPHFGLTEADAARAIEILNK